jgi:hypothetical protein
VIDISVSPLILFSLSFVLFVLLNNNIVYKKPHFFNLYFPTESNIAKGGVKWYNKSGYFQYNCGAATRGRARQQTEDEGLAICAENCGTAGP